MMRSLSMLNFSRTISFRSLAVLGLLAFVLSLGAVQVHAADERASHGEASEATHKESGHEGDDHHAEGHDSHGDEHGGKHTDSHGDDGHDEHPEYEGLLGEYYTEIHHIEAGHAPHDIASIFTVVASIYKDEIKLIKKKKATKYFAKVAEETKKAAPAKIETAEAAYKAASEEEKPAAKEALAAAKAEKTDATYAYEHLKKKKGELAKKLSDNVSPAGYAAYYIYKYAYGIIAGLIVLFYIVLAMLMLQNVAMKPKGGWGGAGEAIVGFFYDFFSGILGKEDARRYLPFLGTLFFFILANNFMSITIFMKSPSAVFFCNLGVAGCVFLYCQYIALTRMGPLVYLHHLMGEPQDIFGWLLSPLFLFLETMGELIRPISLSLRLFGNILGEDILLLVFCSIGIGMAVGITGWEGIPVGVPLHALLAPLIVLFSTIQALVFTLLSAVYISLKVPHGDHDHHGDEAHAH